MTQNLTRLPEEILEKNQPARCSFIGCNTGPNYSRCRLSSCSKKLGADCILPGKDAVKLIISNRALNHGGGGSFENRFIHLPFWKKRESMDLIHDDTHHLCTHFSINGIKANIHWYFRGQTNDKICHCEKSTSTLFILSKRNNDRFSHAKCTV